MGKHLNKLIDDKWFGDSRSFKEHYDEAVIELSKDSEIIEAVKKEVCLNCNRICELPFTRCPINWCDMLEGK